MGSSTPTLKTMCALQDRRLVEIDTRTLYSNGDKSGYTTVPKSIVDAKGLAAGDEVTVQYDQEREEVVIPVGGGDSDD